MDRLFVILHLSAWHRRYGINEKLSRHVVGQLLDPFGIARKKDK